MTNDVRSRRRWIKRGIIGLLAFIVIIIAGLFIYESLAEAATRRNYPPPGQMVDVGGYRLHLHVMGEDRGLPAVILEHGGISMSAQWGWVQPELVQHTQVVAYDRPGMGWSDAPPSPLDAQQVIDDLYAALQQTGVDGPYLLVGHSMGGLMTRLFAQSYPDEVAGMVLVDPRDIAEHELLPFTLDPFMHRVALTASRLGIPRLAGMADADSQGLPPQQYAEAVAIYPSHRQIRGWESEGRLGESATDLLRQGETWGDFPVVVLDATQADGAFDAQQREILTAQFEQIAAQSGGRRQPVPGAGHVTIVTQQQYAQVIVDAVLALLVE
ncbi:MAG: alpha/beta fold hydrolase [Caldilineaceae bacterium]|nr:alpha/beta fold hydrolase [Caldilineaceae bacterium]